MPLTTRCVGCGRQFPVYAQQLKGRRARVNCPQCGEPMDAVAGLIDEPGFVAAPPPNRFGTAPGGPDAVPRTGASPSPALVPAGAPTVARVRTPPVPAAPARRSVRARVGWGLASLVLIASLAVQVAWWWRADLLRHPEVFRVVTAGCDRLGCAVTPPRLPGALAVREPSLTPDLESGVLMLRLRLHNTAQLPQPAPLIELELYDQQGDLAAVRRFSPDEYSAAPPSDAEPGAAPNVQPVAGPALPLAPGEVRAVALALAPPREEASGFKVRLR